MRQLLLGFLIAVLLISLVAARPGDEPVTLNDTQFQQLLHANQYSQVLDVSEVVDLKVQQDHAVVATVIPGNKLLHFGCVVTEPVMGAPLVDLRFVGDFANNIRVYDDSSLFAGAGAFEPPHLGGIRPFSHGDGSQVGDRFDLVLPVDAKGNIVIEFEVTTPATSGKLKCITFIGQ